MRTGAADTDHDGHVSVDDAYAYVFDQVQAVGAAQTPQRWLYGAEGKILLARNPAGPTIVAAPLPESLRAGLDSPHPSIRIGAVTELGEWLAGGDPARATTARRHLQEVADTDIPRVAQTARTLLEVGTAVLSGLASAPPKPSPPELVLSDMVIDLGRLRQHGQSPERRIQMSNTGGGDLNARAATSARWLKLRQTGDELAVTVDTSAPGEHRAPSPSTAKREPPPSACTRRSTLPCRLLSGAAPPTRAESAPGTPDAARPEPELLPEPKPVPDVSRRQSPGQWPTQAAPPRPAVPGPSPGRRRRCAAAPGDGELHAGASAA